MDILTQSNQVYQENFSNKIWYGRCIFLSWYCDLGTCKFCFRSTVKHRIRHAQSAKRSLASLLVEALLCKKLNWRIEFLTGGYRSYTFDQLLEICKNIKEVYGEKIWINLGVLTQEQLTQLKPYVKGIVASIETPNPELHKQICPDKNIYNYFNFLSNVKDFKKSITIVIGLGEKEKDFELLKKIIIENKLDRITFYALKPVRGTSFIQGPDSRYYAEWIARTRIAFPKLQIIAGTTARRVEEIDLLLKAGANAITKFPATKLFNSNQSKLFVKKVKEAGRELTSELNTLPVIDWNKEIDNLNIDDTLKREMKLKMKSYLERMSPNK